MNRGGISMRNLWPQQFSVEDNTPTPKEILERQGKYLLTLTDDLVYTKLIEPSYPDIKPGDEYPFTYELAIKGKFLGDYKHRVFIFR